MKSLVQMKIQIFKVQFELKNFHEFFSAANFEDEAVPT